MKILFVENRYTTYLWEAVARQLETHGHEIFWIVQNKEFLPSIGTIYILNNFVPPNYTSKNTSITLQALNKIIKADRGINYYKLKSHTHIYYIKDQIERIVDEIKPGMGIGECTLFHELLTMEALKMQNTPYFFPTSSRFPTGRIAFYEFDTLIPFGGQEDEIDNAIAGEMVRSIANRTTQAFSLINLYSAPPTTFEKIKDKIRILKGYYKGDKYNTPTVNRKLYLKKYSKKKRARWDEHGLTLIDNLNGFNILYPLQMQPESTIDVWATDFNNQAGIIKDLLDNTPENVHIVVKPNPTSNQEITEEMLDLLSSSRVIPIKHGIKMAEILNDINLVVTTTGTIGLESIFANKPVITLINNYFNKAKNCIYIDSYDKLPGIIKLVEQNNFPKMEQTEMVDYINYLNKTSYAGMISCTFTQRAVLDPVNIGMLEKAFLDVIDRVEKGNNIIEA